MLYLSPLGCIEVCDLPGAARTGDDFRDKMLAGVRISGTDGSLETGTSGRLLMIAVISAIKVDNTS